MTWTLYAARIPWISRKTTKPIVVATIAGRSMGLTAGAGPSRDAVAGSVCGWAADSDVGAALERDFMVSLSASAERACNQADAHLRMFTARPATITTVVIEASASRSMSSLARTVRGIVSVGLNAVALVKDRYR